MDGQVAFWGKLENFCAYFSGILAFLLLSALFMDSGVLETRHSGLHRNDGIADAPTDWYNVSEVSTELPLILASTSLRRKQLLAEAGYVFEIVPPDEHAENERKKNELPMEYVRRLALQKGKNVADKVEQGIIISADTIVLCGKSLLEKPTDRKDARKMLQQLRGQIHSVVSGLCLIKKEIEKEDVILQDVATTRLIMQPISDDLLEAYLDTGAWKGKAGAFGYQDGNDWLTILEGSESNVVGLPLELFQTMYTA